MAFDARPDQGGSSASDVLIIGTGFAGLCMAIKLREAGMNDFTVLERAEGPGGTWRDNNYPGCGCDVQSHLYSFSFEPNPEWTRMFARQPEIKAYLEHCVEKYGLAPNIRYGASVVEARFDETASVWRVLAADGRRFHARFLVSGMGGLSTPAYPDVPGLARFKGRRFHSAEWDHSYDLAGKRVAVIGTGASAIQFVPQIQKQVAKLDLYQRTAPWIMPKADRAISEREREWFRKYPVTQKLVRAGIYALMESRALGFVVYPKLLSFGEKFALSYLERKVKDPVLRAKLTPDFAFGCKRVLISNDYFPALTQPNVEVITIGIREVRANSVVSEDGTERTVDAIIYGTGFKAQDPLPRGAIFGRKGIDLLDAWKDGVEAYLGTTIHGFPNLFMLVGPNTGLGHNSMVYMIESQVHYVMECLKLMRRRGLCEVETRQAVQSKFNLVLQQRHGKTVWTSGCKSWYLDKNGKNTTLWPGFTFEFRAATRKFRPADYTLVAASRRTAASTQE